METERWHSVKDLLHQAMQLAPESRARFLDEACSSDFSLRSELESLLSANEGVGSSFMQSPPLAGIDYANALEAGQVFAHRFQLVRKLGEGGMGQVWLAEQTSPVRRLVALKLIKAGMYDDALVQRFQAERQSLAIMEHPAIAKVFDAGATERGQPYFVMEYVPGPPITEYCDQKKLTIPQRLELFIQACEGVQHAHQKAIIHRDLKPANILVVEIDGKPVPRIIDFGLAKATSPEVAGESLFTQLGSFVGTPGYMSPEQADASGQDIDTRTDVYSLGVILYVLLTGSLPIETRLWQKQPLVELLRKLREEEPPRPSARVGKDCESSTATAQSRGTEPVHLVNLLRGDLDWITMKAIEKDRARRYGAPSELAADIRRYLDHEPIIARPASAGYRLRKYARRHRLAVAVATGLIMLLAGFSILQTLQLRRITRERDRATRITDFMTGMFKVSDPNEARGNTVTAREILDKASADMAKGLAKDPEVQSQMMLVMAKTYLNLGLYARAHELAKSALDARLGFLETDDPRILEAMAQLGPILEREGHYPEAEKQERETLAAARRVLGPEDELTLVAMNNLADTLYHKGDYEEMEKLEREVIDVATRRLGAENTQALRAMNSLGNALFSQAHYTEAEQEYRQVLDIDRRVLGPDHAETLNAMGGLGLAVQFQGRLPEAEKLLSEVVAGQQRVLGLAHQTTINSVENLAIVLADEGRQAEAEKMFREAFATVLRSLGPEHPLTLMAQSNLAETLLKDGHIHEAEHLQREAITADVRVYGPESPHTLESQSDLASILNREGRYAEAEELARKTFEVQLRRQGPQHPDTIDTLQQLGTAMAHSQRYDEAAKLFRDVIEKGNNSKAYGGQFAAWYDFACVAMAANRPDEALKYLREAVNRGYSNGDGLMADDDLKSLRSNPKFQELVAQLRQPSTLAPVH